MEKVNKAQININEKDINLKETDYLISMINEKKKMNMLKQNIQEEQL